LNGDLKYTDSIKSLVLNPLSKREDLKKSLRKFSRKSHENLVPPVLPCVSDFGSNRVFQTKLTNMWPFNRKKKKKEEPKISVRPYISNSRSVRCHPDDGIESSTLFLSHDIGTNKHHHHHETGDGGHFGVAGSSGGWGESSSNDSSSDSGSYDSGSDSSSDSNSSSSD
jgi:hypothetical protein